jgi:Icc-related predicted phosphoesterase
MKILVGTDFHGKEAVFEGFAEKAEEERADVLVICGDITHFGTLQEAKRLLSLLTGLRLPVLFVPGNCDPQSLAGVDVEGARCIHGKNVSYGDITFLGVGGSPPTPFRTPFEMSEETLMKTLARASSNLPANLWTVLVSHAPPYGTRLDQASLGHHAGSRSVRKFIEERSPSIVFCGHIHEGKGEDRINGTIIVNPGPARHGDYAKAFFNNNITVNLDSL